MTELLLTNTNNSWLAKKGLKHLLCEAPEVWLLLLLHKIRLCQVSNKGPPMYGYGRSVLWFWLLLLRYDNMISYHHTVRITGYIILQLPRGSTGIFHDKLRYGTEQGDHISLSYVPGIYDESFFVVGCWMLDVGCTKYGTPLSMIRYLLYSTLYRILF